MLQYCRAVKQEEDGEDASEGGILSGEFSYIEVRSLVCGRSLDFLCSSLERWAPPDGKAVPIQGQVARTGIVKRPAEEAEGELGYMFWVVRLGELSKQLAFCITSPSTQKA